MSVCITKVWISFPSYRMTTELLKDITLISTRHTLSGRLTTTPRSSSVPRAAVWMKQSRYANRERCSVILEKSCKHSKFSCYLPGLSDPLSVSPSRAQTVVLQCEHTRGMGQMIYSIVHQIYPIMRRTKLSAQWKLEWWGNPLWKYSRSLLMLLKGLHHRAGRLSHHSNVKYHTNLFSFEKMINLGTNWDTVHWPDNWTATTVDGKKSAQFEETLL